MTLAFNEGLGVEVEQFAEFSQKLGRAVQPDGGLQVRTLQRLAQHATEFAVHANVDIGFNQSRYIGQVTAQRKDHVDLGANTLHQTTNFRQVAGRVEGAVARANDVDARLFASRSLGKRLACRHLAQAILAPQPVHGSIGALPLVFIDGAGQEPLDVGALGCDAAPDHLGDGAGHHHSRQLRVEGGMGALHGPFGALTSELLLRQSGDHDR